MIARLVCAIKGHRYTAKTVLQLEYTRCSIETCDRCGDGERDLALGRREADRFLQLYRRQGI